MNRKEAMHTLKDIFDYFWIDIEDKGIDGELTEIMEVLEQPATLADFLGWEEDVVYRRGGSYFKIEGNHLLHKGHSGKWVNMNLQTWELIDLRQAKKVEKKLKAYHVKDEYSYKELMKELEEQGYTWSSDEKATDVSYGDISKINTVIYCHENKTLTYSSLNCFNRYRKNSYNLIEYHKEEPKYLLQTDLTSENGVQYLSFDKKRKKYFLGALMTSENVQQKFTDSEILKIKSITRFAKLCEKVEVQE